MHIILAQEVYLKTSFMRREEKVPQNTSFRNNRFGWIEAILMGVQPLQCVKVNGYMSVKYMQSIKGTSEENEDAVGYRDNYYWVIDGATALFENPVYPPFTVADIVNDLSDTLPENIDDSKSLSEILHDSIQTVAQYRLHTSENTTTREQYAKLPTFAIMLIRVMDDTLEYLSLGDCYLTIGDKTVTDKRIEPFATRNRKRIQRIIDEHGTITAEERKNIFQNTRLKANAVDGYPIGSLDPHSAYGAKTGTISLHNMNATIVLYSDGFVSCYNPQEPIESSLKSLAYSNYTDKIYGKRDDASVLVVEV